MKRLYASLVLLSLIWGSSFFFIKVLLDYFEPASIAFLRCLFGVITIAFIMLILRKPLNVKKIPWRAMIIVGLFLTSVPWYLIGFSETRLTSSMASVLNATTPIWTIFTGLLFFNTKPLRNHWIGLVAGFCGILILLRINPEQIISVDLIGVIAMLAATCCYGYSSQLSKRGLHELTVYQTVFGTLLVGSISSGIIAFSFESISLKPLIDEPITTLSFFMLGSLGSAVAYMIFFYLIQEGSAEFSTMVTYLVPVTAIFWGLFLLEETIHWTLITGLAFILLGIFLLGRKPDQVSNAVNMREESKM